MRHFRLAVSLIAIAVVSTACIEEPTVVSLTNADVAGSYSLRAVNGGALPAIIQQGIGTQQKIEILSDQITVGADGSWSGVESTRITTPVANGTPTVETKVTNTGGTYTVSGRSVYFKDAAAGSGFAVTFSGDAFLLTDGVSTYLYSK